MRIELIRRPERSSAMSLLSPIIAIVLTVITGFFIFLAIGVDPLEALYIYFIEPLTAWWTVEALLIKAAPIILIAIGLSLCYRSNNWNIGAEGQLVAGAIAGSVFPILVPEWNGPLVLPVMLLMGIAGGMLYGAIPALLKIRFGTNEILTSLMLVYVAQLFLDWLARGPWRNPEGYNFPDSREFDGWQVLPVVFGDDVRLNAIFVLIAVAVAWFVLSRTITGFQISVLGQAPRAAAFAGFSQKRMVLMTFLISGGLAGLAGICEVAGPIEMLRTSVSPGYGFTAIIVAFLGRLNPVGILFAGLLLALSYIGGEGIQIVLGVSDQITRVFQGMLLFFVLTCDTFIFYRVRFVSTRRSAAAEATP
ncbi:ABC transporter permease [Bauldia litoralis]|uniref:Nucleoside ABC transporter membrane protein n=1 Tax=Bauldia litoralis TaxID=665467 RepID=A0A1G6B0P0_9HYPH|nr:ABC transporter permease [Bauldia litoralis]SDB14250.1 nucleoside ABC transporter membrane protein [Bauldia litoralis]